MMMPKLDINYHDEVLFASDTSFLIIEPNFALCSLQNIIQEVGYKASIIC